MNLIDIDTHAVNFVDGLQKLHRDRSDVQAFLEHEILHAAGCTHMQLGQGIHVLHKLMTHGFVQATVGEKNKMKRFIFSLTKTGSNHKLQPATSAR